MSDLRVLVTGAGRGIGRAIALRFAREGAKVAVMARTSPELDSVAAEIEAAGGQGLAAQMNVRDQGSVEAAVYRAVQFLDERIDVLVNNAGVFEIVPIEELSTATWVKTMEVNLYGPFYVVTECLDAIEESECPQMGGFRLSAILDHLRRLLVVTHAPGKRRGRGSRGIHQLIPQPPAILRWKGFRQARYFAAQFL